MADPNSFDAEGSSQIIIDSIYEILAKLPEGIDTQAPNIHGYAENPNSTRFALAAICLSEFSRQVTELLQLQTLAMIANKPIKSPDVKLDQSIWGDLFKKGE